MKYEIPISQRQSRSWPKIMGAFCIGGSDTMDLPRSPNPTEYQHELSRCARLLHQLGYHCQWDALDHVSRRAHIRWSGQQYVTLRSVCFGGSTTSPGIHARRQGVNRVVHEVQRDTGAKCDIVRSDARSGGSCTQTRESWSGAGGRSGRLSHGDSNDWLALEQINTRWDPPVGELKMIIFCSW